MKYEQLMDTLHSMDEGDCYPIFIPSVLRPAHFTYQNMVKHFSKCLKDRVFYVVREDEYKTYKAAQPDTHFVIIKNKDIHPGFGTDSTRKFIQTYAIRQGIKRYFDVDDDFSFITMAYGAEKTTRRLVKKDREANAGQILTLASMVSEQLFSKYPNLVLGGFSRITPVTCSIAYHKDKAIINGMGIPRAFMIVDVNRARKLSCLRTGRYDVHCEDIGFCERILSKGGDLFKLPSFLIGVPSHEVNPRTETRIQKKSPDVLWHEAEELLLDSYIGPYLSYTTASHVDGLKRPTGIDWKKYHKAHGTKIVVEEW